MTPSDFRSWSPRRVQHGSLVRPLFVALVLAACGGFAAAAEIALPPELKNWQDWALHGLEYRRCPFLATADPAEPQAHRCAWPERLSLDLNAQGGSFNQRWQVFAESWVTLPGNLEYWPAEVRANGAPAAVVARDDVPQVLLAAGNHVLSGRFRWDARPESLPVSPRTALVDLTVDGLRIAQPERPNGAIWLGKRRSAEQPRSSRCRSIGCCRMRFRVVC